jgi:hypothetical protein
MEIEFVIYEDCSTAFSKYPKYTHWMRSFLSYINGQITHTITAEEWDCMVKNELNTFSAKMLYDNNTGRDILRFEDEQYATLFFLKFS